MVSRLAMLAGLLSATSAFAQVATPTTAAPPKLTIAQIGLFVHPARGQSPGQQTKDEDACYGWAEANTGLDSGRWQCGCRGCRKGECQGRGSRQGGPGHGHRGRRRAGDRGNQGKTWPGRSGWRRGGLSSRLARPCQGPKSGGPGRRAAGRPGESTGRGPVQESCWCLSRGAGLLRQMTSAQEAP